MAKTMPHMHDRLWVDLPPKDFWHSALAEHLGGSRAQELLEPAGAMADRVRIEALNEGTKSFLQWVEDSYEAGGKAIYSWTKGAQKPLDTSAYSRAVGDLVMKPLDLVEHHRASWAEWWQATSSSLVDVVALFDTIKDRAKEEYLPKLTLKDVDAALYSFHDATAQGLDLVGPLHIKHLPAHARGQLCGLLNACTACLAWPWQALCSLIVLKAKPTGVRGHLPS